MKFNYADNVVLVEEQQNRAFNNLRSRFSKEMLIEFHKVKGNLEDIWDLVENEDVLDNRMKVLANKSNKDESDYLQISLISCILWNGIDTVIPE